MRFLIRTHLSYETQQPCDLLLQIEALSNPVQKIETASLTFDPASRCYSLVAEPDIGPRHWVSAGPQFECHYEATVEVTRQVVDLQTLDPTPRLQIPGNAIRYLMPSRYCHSDVFLEFVSTQFGHQAGGAQVAAMRDWIEQNFTYDSAATHAGTTAQDTFDRQSGVCRDFAHVMISFARAAGIPARFASVYGPNVSPQDFHAVAEVYLAGGWHLVDPTGMSHPAETVVICTGLDAAETSFLTSYGWINLITQTVEVEQLG